MMNRILAICLYLFFISGTSLAEVYKWVDSEGVVYFTDDFTRVPEEYRPEAEALGLPGDTEETNSERDLTSRGKEKESKDRLGRGETYWRGLVDVEIRKMRESEDRLEVLRNKYNGLTERFNASRSTAERGGLRVERDQTKNEMDRCKNQIEEARNMVQKKIPEEAELYGANPEWVRP